MKTRPITLADCDVRETHRAGHTLCRVTTPAHAQVIAGAATPGQARALATELLSDLAETITEPDAAESPKA